MNVQLTPSAGVQRLPVGLYIAVAPQGSGKSTILPGLLNFTGDAIVSRDTERAALSGVCGDLFHRMVPSACMHHEDQVTELVTAKLTTRLTARKSTLLDATNTTDARIVEAVELAHRHGMAAVVLRRAGRDSSDVDLDFCLANNASRTRQVPVEVIRRTHAAYLDMTAEKLYDLGVDVVAPWTDSTAFELMPETSDARHLTVKPVVLGDLHGVKDTFFIDMLEALGTDANLSNPDVFIVGCGDINDKGPHSVEQLRWWLWAVRTGRALLVDSNHNKALVRALTKPDAVIRYGLGRTLAEIEAQPDAEQLKAQIVAQFSHLPSHLVFADLIVVHAAIKEPMLFSTDAKSRGYMLHNREPWEWTGTQKVVHGHVEVEQPQRRRAEPADPLSPPPGEVLSIDTAACKGHGLTAYVSAADDFLTVTTRPEDIIDPQHEQQLIEELISAGIVAGPIRLAAAS